MNTESIFGPVAIGKDTSGNFKLSPYGLAVRSTPDGGFIARHNDELVDVTDLTFDGTESLVYRVPKKSPAKRDIVLRSENPFSVLFVDEVLSDGRVKGTDPATGDIQEYRPVSNLLSQALSEHSGGKHDVHFFVTVVGPEDLLKKNHENDLLPLLLLGTQSTGTSLTDPFTTILLSRSLGSSELEDGALALFALLKAGVTSGSNDTIALLLALQGGSLFAGGKAGKTANEGETRVFTRNRRTKKRQATK